jgi:hypothetical protein
LFDEESESARYHGMVRWDVLKRRLELIPNMTNKLKKMYITFEGSTEATEEECAEKLFAFVKTYGGPNGMSQWGQFGIDNEVEKMWNGAKELWGPPTWSTSFGGS